MTVDSDIAAVGTRWATDPRFGMLMQAIQHAEGGRDALERAVNCSVSVQNRAQALEVTARTITHRLIAYIVDRDVDASFLLYLSKSWAPIGAANDPTHLNDHWAGNVLSIWHQLMREAAR